MPYPRRLRFNTCSFSLVRRYKAHTRTRLCPHLFAFARWHGRRKAGVALLLFIGVRRVVHGANRCDPTQYLPIRLAAAPSREITLPRSLLLLPEDTTYTTTTWWLSDAYHSHSHAHADLSFVHSCHTSWMQPCGRAISLCL